MGDYVINLNSKPMEFFRDLMNTDEKLDPNSLWNKSFHGAFIKVVLGWGCRVKLKYQIEEGVCIKTRT